MWLWTGAEYLLSKNVSASNLIYSLFNFHFLWNSVVESGCRISFVCLRRSIWWFEALWQWSLVIILQDCQCKQLDNVITQCLANLVEVIERSSVTENITRFCAFSYTHETTKTPRNIMRPNLCRPLFPLLYRFAKKCISAGTAIILRYNFRKTLDDFLIPQQKMKVFVFPF